LIVRGKVENPEVIPNFTALQTLNPGISCWIDSLDFVRRMPELEHFRRRFPDARLGLYRWPSPDEYLEMG
jgi:hypothetical protein